MNKNFLNTDDMLKSPEKPIAYQKDDILKSYTNLSWGFQWLKYPPVLFIIERLKGKEWRFVGGCVRDSLIGKETKDIDINTGMLPEETLELFKDCHYSEIGREHGTIMIFLQDYKFEITTLRVDTKTDGRHAIVSFNGDWYTDSSRRDFTINALMLDGGNMTLYDYQGGLADLNERKVNFIGDMMHRIEEDYLRILRFIRFTIRFEKNYKNDDVLDKIRKYVPGLLKVSMERITQEIFLILKEKNWQEGAILLHYLQVDSKILNINFNENFNNFPWDLVQINSLKEKIAFLILGNSEESIKNLPIPNNMKKMLIKINLDLSHILINQDYQLLFSIFSMNQEEINLIKIKTLLLSDKFAFSTLEKINNLRENMQFMEKFQIILIIFTITIIVKKQ